MKTQSLTERKLRDRERQAARRKAMKETRRPSTHQCDAAIVEAFAFQLRVHRTRKDAAMSAAVPVADIIATAKAILVDRDGFDLAQTKIALRARIDPRREHEWHDHIPSIVPPGSPQVARDAETAS